MRRAGPPEERFWARVDRRGDDDCWPWLGFVRKSGYGSFCVGGQPRYVRAHRFSYVLAYGAVPAGLVLDHLCRNRACVNPAHLEAVTNRVNSLRGVSPAAANAAKTHCSRGHSFADHAKLRPDGRREYMPCQAFYARRRSLRHQPTTKTGHSLRAWARAHPEAAAARTRAAANARWGQRAEAQA